MQKCHKDFDRDFQYKNRDKDREVVNGKIFPMDRSLLYKNSFPHITRHVLF